MICCLVNKTKQWSVLVLFSIGWKSNKNIQRNDESYLTSRNKLLKYLVIEGHRTLTSVTMVFLPAPVKHF